MGESYIITDRAYIDDFELLTYDALRNASNSHQRMSWIMDSSPFFDNDSLEFWRIYKDSTSDLPEEYMREERRLFLMRPYFVARKDDRVAGGIWLADMERVRGEAIQHFHLAVDESMRRNGAGNALLSMMERELGPACDGFSCEWEARREEGQLDFFSRKGYDVKKGRVINSAFKAEALI